MVNSCSHVILDHTTLLGMTLLPLCLWLATSCPSLLITMSSPTLRTAPLTLVPHITSFFFLFFPGKLHVTTGQLTKCLRAAAVRLPPDSTRRSWRRVVECSWGQRSRVLAVCNSPCVSNTSRSAWMNVWMQSSLVLQETVWGESEIVWLKWTQKCLNTFLPLY